MANENRSTWHDITVLHFYAVLFLQSNFTRSLSLMLLRTSCILSRHPVAIVVHVSRKIRTYASVNTQHHWLDCEKSICTNPLTYINPCEWHQLSTQIVIAINARHEINDARQKTEEWPEYCTLGPPMCIVNGSRFNNN